MSLFKPPRELRDHICLQNLTIEKGYRHHHINTNRLRLESEEETAKDGPPSIDLSLLYVCKAVYLEARDVPPCTDPISFTATRLNPGFDNTELSQLATRFESTVPS